MKIVFLVLLMFISSLLVGSELSYKKGIDSYNNGDYKKAVEFFKASKDKYSSVDMQFLWAESEEKLERIEYAIAGYERILMLDSKNIDASLKLVELYKKTAQNNDAYEIASGIDSKELTTEQKKYLKMLLNKNLTKLYKFNGYLNLNMGYDSNIATRAKERDINIYALDTNLSSTQKNSISSIEGGAYLQSLMKFSYLHDLTHKNGWFVKFDTTAMAQINSYNSLYNTRYIKIDGLLGYKFLQTTLTFPISYDFTYYLNLNLLKGYSFTPTLSTILTPNFIFYTNLKLNQKKYLETKYENYDSSSYGGSCSFYYMFNKNYVMGKILYEKSSLTHNKKTTSPLYVDYWKLSPSFGIKYSLWSDYILKLNYQFDLKIFKDDTYESKKRKDKYQNVSLGILKMLTKSLKVVTKYRYSTNNTNYKIADYDKHNLSVGLEYSF